MYKMSSWRKKKIILIKPKFSDFHKIWENGQSCCCRIIHFNDKEQSTKNSNRVITSHYGIWSFVPLFVCEQLRHFSNQYFIFISALQQIPDASPIGRFTTIIPLSVIFCFSAITSMIKDIIKHTADKEVNRRRVEVLRHGILVREKWKDIGVGDVIRVKNYDKLPADAVLLSSSELRGTCFLETTDLDGENGLKIKHCLPETMHCENSKDFSNLNGTIECELPIKSADAFVGRLTISNQNRPLPLDDGQFLPRGSVLRRAKWIYGVVVYSGRETKTIRNQTSALPKRSKMDKIVRSHIVIISALIFALSLLCSVCCSWWTRKHFRNHWYLEIKNVDAYTFCIQTISFFILFHNVIPVTLHVYIKLVREIQAWFINNDVDMYHENCNRGATVRSPDLNVELGKVKHIFSDKTGTLTKNIMKFKHCSIGGELYLEGSQNKLRNNMLNHSTKKYIVEFFRMMAVCHTIVPEETKPAEETSYSSASSADERALIVGCKRFGFDFRDRGPKSVTIDASGAEERYEILNVIGYTNARRMMSVVVRTPDSKIKLYCKGSDEAVFKCLSRSGEKFKNRTAVHANNFARAGYRTLCFACADVSEGFYETWNDEYLEASAALRGRDAAKRRAAEKIEKRLKLIGATAIENQLQDHVPKTIRSLMTANIKIWILTGDKQEAAINVGLSAEVIARDGRIIVLNESKPARLSRTIHKNLNVMDLTAANSNSTLIVDGPSLSCALSDDRVKMDFLRLCLGCKAVICCRISSAQKSEIVELVTKYTDDVTLAIGDEVNDVPMLKEASIGIGILGLEGLQASNAADYSITQFEHLSKLLFVHGACNYEKISKMIYFFYYKNVCFYAFQLWFAAYSGWSSQVLFDRWCICTYNVLFTATPPLIVGLFLTTRSAESRLRFPQLYSQTKDVFNYKMFTMWTAIAVFHSIFLFWTCLFAMKNEVIWTNGKAGEYPVFGNIVYSCALVVVCLKAGLHVQSWSFVVHLTTWVSILSWALFVIVYNRLEKMLLVFFISMNLNENMFKSSVFWLVLVFNAIAVLTTDVAVLTIKRAVLQRNKGTTTIDG